MLLRLSLSSKAAAFVAGLLVIGLYQAELAMAESRSEQNLKIMLEAAKRLKFGLAARSFDGHATGNLGGSHGAINDTRKWLV